MIDNGDRSGRRSTLALLRVASVVVVVVAAWVAAWLVRFDGMVPTEQIARMITWLPAIVLLQLTMLVLAGATRHSWRHTTLSDLVPLINAVLATAVGLVMVRTFAPVLVAEWGEGLEWTMVPFGVIAAYAVIVGLGLTAARVMRRVIAERDAATPDADESRRVLLLGAGRAGVIVARELRSRPDLGIVPVGFVDDDPQTHGRRIAQLDVLGDTTALPELIERFDVDDVVITIASADGPTMRQLIERCEAADRQPLIVPAVPEIVGGTVSLNWFRPVAAEDLLGRDPVELELSELTALLGGEVVMVTGAGGSIGSELCRQIARFAPAQLVLVERAEPALWAIHRELVADHPGVTLVPAMADVTDVARIGRLLADHRPAVVFHAAAHKHVPMMEDNPGEAVKNNVGGTRTVVDACVAQDVDRFVLISTDKAVNPTSVMGATKRLAERYVQHVASATGRDYVSVRFGNVLGSTGSVVPIFQQQIETGGPVTVTDPEMRRYFMTIPEASQLVLQATLIGSSGEILVLDMGEPVRIVELAESLIRLSGYEPYEEIDIEFTGLRPGEKLFEELALTEEGAERTRHPKVYIGRTPTPDWDAVDHDLAQLAELADRLPAADVRHAIAARVPEFIHGDTTEFHPPVVADPTAAT